MNQLLPRRDAERGQILLIAAGGMIVFLLIAGLVIDAGIGFRERRTAQNISDLSAMAGTKVIADFHIDDPSLTGGDVYAAIDDSVKVNGCPDADSCEWNATYVRPIPNTMTEEDLGPVVANGPIPPTAQGVRVETERSARTYFMRVIGIAEVDVATSGTALTSEFIDGAPEGVLLPMGIFDTDYETGVNYTLQDGMNGPGNFGWISWDGSQSMADLSKWVCTSSNPEIPEWPMHFNGQTGVKTGQSVASMRDCLDDYVESGTTVLLPLWDQANGQGANLKYNLVGLAAFKITGFGSPVISTISGQFIGFYNLSPVPGGYGGIPCNLSDPDCTTKTNFIGLTR